MQIKLKFLKLRVLYVITNMYFPVNVRSQNIKNKSALNVAISKK